MIYPIYEGPKIDVLYEDSNCIILNKSPSTHSHPLKYNEKDNCLSFLRENNYFEALKVNEYNMDRGLLYRLDYGTSGVLVLVKDELDYLHLRDNFNNLVGVIAGAMIYNTNTNRLQFYDGSGWRTVLSNPV